jgi:hypothetical protein
MTRADRRSLLLALVLPLAAVACAASPPAKPPPFVPDPVATPEVLERPLAAAPRSTASIPPLPQTRRIAVRLAFDASGLHVRVTANGDAPELARWKMPEDPMTEVAVEDGEGVMKSFERLEGMLDVGAPRTTVAVVYDVKPEAGVDDALRTIIEQNRFRAMGERILALPVAFDGQRIEATVVIDAHAVDVAMSASSFGVGDSRIRHVVKTTGAELRRTAFFAGGGGHAVFDMPEGHDESAWLGWTAFDPRAVSAEIAGFRGVLHDYFKGVDLDPATTLFVADERPRGRFRIMPRAGGILVNVGGKDPYDAPLRLAVGHELAHAWIGGRLWVGDGDAYWFQEGFARWVSREQLARAGLLSPDEYVAEVNRLLGVVVTTPRDKRTMPASVARGALFATILDARIREKSQGARSLDHLLRALVHANEAMRVKLTADEFFAAAAREGGDVVRTDFDDIVTTAKRGALPNDALGGCFEARDVSYDVLEPGFDLAATRADNEKKVRGVDAKGAASKAGLRDGDRLVKAEDPIDPTEVWKLEIERDGRPQSIAFKPAGAAKKGQGFRRKPGLSDDACKKLALRK